jgi:hypothetical protein
MLGENPKKINKKDDLFNDVRLNFIKYVQLGFTRR